MKRAVFRRGFTLIELVVVLMVILMLATMVVPSMSQMLKGSKVQQTAKIVIAALYKARAEAQRFRSDVAVYYGDDPSRHVGRWVAPLSTTLPAKSNQIEIWTVAAGHNVSDMYLRDNGNYNWYQDSFNSGQIHPLDPATGGPNGNSWFPFYMKGTLLTPQPFTFPEGVRIIAGYYSDDLAGNRALSWTNYNNTPVGEIKRHYSVMTRNGAVPTFSDDHCYRALLIYDVASGEHVIIEVGEWKSTSRPRVLEASLTKVAGTLLTSPSMIDSLIK